MCDKIEDLGSLPNGCHLFRKPNGAGGFTYYSDEVGGGVMVWDTYLINESTLLTAIVCEHQRKYIQFMIDGGWKPTPKMEIEHLAAIGGSFIPPDFRAVLKEQDGKPTESGNDQQPPSPDVLDADPQVVTRGGNEQIGRRE